MHKEGACSDFTASQGHPELWPCPDGPTTTSVLSLMVLQNLETETPGFTACFRKASALVFSLLLATPVPCPVVQFLLIAKFEHSRFWASLKVVGTLVRILLW